MIIVVDNLGVTWTTFKSKLKKKKKKRKFTLKKFLISFKKKICMFRQKEHSGPKIKKFFDIFSKKAFLLFREMNHSSSKVKKLLTFQEGIFQA